MELNGREVGFAYTMRASKMFAEFCPNRDISKVGDTISGKYGNIIDNQVRFILALNQAYVKSAEHREEGQKPITEDELLDLDNDAFAKVFVEATQALNHDSETHIETKPTKKVNARPAKGS